MSRSGVNRRLSSALSWTKATQVKGGGGFWIGELLRIRDRMLGVGTLGHSVDPDSHTGHGYVLDGMERRVQRHVV